MHGDGQGHGDHGPVTADEPDPTQESGKPDEPPEAVAGAVMVSLVDNRFNPAKITVPVGTTVTWVNEGGNWHNLACADAKFRTAALKSGESFSHRFDQPGTFRVVCTLHARQGMTQTVEVTG
jgi:plastocyanin